MQLASAIIEGDSSLRSGKSPYLEALLTGLVWPELRLSGNAGAGLDDCKVSVDLFGLEKNDFIPHVADVNRRRVLHQAAEAQIVFTRSAAIDARQRSPP